MSDIEGTLDTTIERLAQRYAAQVEELNSDPNLSPEGRERENAEAHRHHLAQAQDALRRARAIAAEAHLAARTALGMTAVSTRPSGDPTEVANHRAAQEWARGARSAEEAVQMALDATISGDRGREHAVFEVAFERSLQRQAAGLSPGLWGELVDAYVERHPTMARRIEEFRKASATVAALENPNRNSAIALSLRIPKRGTSSPKPPLPRFARGTTSMAR